MEKDGFTTTVAPDEVLPIVKDPGALSEKGTEAPADNTAMNDSLVRAQADAARQLGETLRKIRR